MTYAVGDFGLLVPTPIHGWNVAQLNFLPVVVDGTGALMVAGGGGGGGGLTDAELRASPVPMSLASVPSHPVTNAGTFAVQVTSAPTTAVTGTFFQATQPVSLASVPSHAVTNAGTFAVQVTSAPTTAVTGPLTDAQLRAAAVPMSLASVPSHAVTNAGTFAVQVTSAPTTAVTGTFWQATQPVSGPLTDAQLRATAVPVSFTEASVLFHGRASTFNTPGRAGTTGQKILSLHNATGSAVTVKVTRVVVDLACTVVKALTVAPPIIRLWKVTVLPTNGTALAKIKIGGTSTSNASVTVLGDASADNTGSATTLTATLPAGQIVTQEYAPRFVTGAGYEMADRIEFLADISVTLNALEGVVLFLDYTLATQNPTTDRWIAGIEWKES